MNFVIIANAWKAGHDNPTSKHQIALELTRQGHRVLWMEGAGMRRPALGSSADRGRIARKLRAALGGAVPAPGNSAIWVLAPLLIPLPTHKCVRAFNGWLFAAAARRWCRRLGFTNAVLINYVPVLAEAMRFWSHFFDRRKHFSKASLNAQRSTSNVQRPRFWALSVGRWMLDVHSRLSSSIRRAPKSAPNTEHGFPVIYHCVDRWDKFDMYDSDMMRQVDADCCRYADVVIASSRDLYDHCRKMHQHVHLIAHGVDREHFAAALDRPSRPTALPTGRIAGFFGLLSEWVDQELLIKLARGIPDLQIVLIGKADVPVESLDGEPNIHLLGPVPFLELPSYIAHFNVGLIPFKVTELTRAVNPIKLREMLAAGCPVVSTDLPEVAAFAGSGSDAAVEVASDTKAFTACVKRRLEHPATVDEKKRISESMRSETWAAKVGEIIGQVRRLEGWRGTPGDQS